MTGKTSPRMAFLTLTALATLLPLTACETAPTDGAAPETSIAQTKKAPAPVDKAILYGDKTESLSSIESLYNRYKSDSLIAARYAKALRKNGDQKKAMEILAPLVKKKNAPTLAHTEMAALQLEKGNLASAEGSARKAIKVDNNNYRAWHILGVSLDAQQKYPEAETAFRKALDLWQGDAVPVMNNLALNLAAQGYTDKALELLYQAKDKDSGRVEIERNIRIIRTLNEPAEYQGEKKVKQEE
jgi:Flp pilus assembly protein TadD